MSNNFEAYTDDAIAIHDAISHFFTDDSGLIAILGSRSRKELELIDLAFRAKYGFLLADKIKKDTSGHFERVLVDIIQTPALTDATYLHDSMAGLGTDEKILDEILATRDGHELDAIKQAFVERYHHGSEQAIKGDTSGKYENLLLTLHNGPRGKDTESSITPAVHGGGQSQGGHHHGHHHEEGGGGDRHHEKNEFRTYVINPEKVAEDAKLLHDNPSEMNFTFILGNSSHQHIMALRDYYLSTHGKPLQDLIHSNTHGDYRDLLTILVTPRAEYFAEVAYNAMKGLIVHDHKLIRVITTRFGIDLPEIKEVFVRKYNKSLHDMVHHNTSGDYKKIMLAIIGA